MNSKIKQDTDTSAPSSSRRRFMQQAGALTAAGAAVTVMPLSHAWAASSQARVESFQKLSAFLVSRDLDPILGERYYAGLAKYVPDFDTQIASLSEFVATNKLANMDAFMAAPQVPAALKAFANKVVTAWYLGIVGDDTHAELVAYADALMYAPTKGILTVPSYGPGPDTWGQPYNPATHVA